MAWTLFRTKRSLIKIETRLLNEIREIDMRFEEVEKVKVKLQAELDAWMKQKAFEAGYGRKVDSVDSWIRNSQLWHFFDDDPRSKKIKEYYHEQFELGKRREKLLESYSKVARKISDSII